MNKLSHRNNYAHRIKRTYGQNCPEQILMKVLNKMDSESGA